MRPWSLMLALLVVSCASPSLQMYTLELPADAAARPEAESPLVIEIARVAVPDELDSQDILVRDGITLRRSGQGRWASRLSLGLTARLRDRLAARRPDALVTDRSGGESPSYRLDVTVSRLDVAASGEAALDADWAIVPHDPKKPITRRRVGIREKGAVATDADVVTLVGTMADRLAGAIVLSGLR